MAFAAFCGAFGAAGEAQAAKPPRSRELPDIRISADNRVPACVTPGRLMRFLRDRNTTLDARYARIAAFYKHHGEANRVRWDYAFFQMAVETNYLTFRKGNGQPGDVKPAQNNFAGIGTTGGGVPGDSFPDVSTGVLAQIQHLMAYSGERIAEPVAPRTRDKQDDIISQSKRLRRDVTFRDLAGRWAADRRYHRTLAVTADRFFSAYCNAPDDTEVASSERGDRAILSGGGAVARPGETLAVATSAPPPPAGIASSPAAVGPRPEVSACGVFTASYGGDKAVLVRSMAGQEVRYTAVQVLAGFENSLVRSFIAQHAQGGEAIGEFASRREALVKAFELCPTARRAASSR